MPSHIPQPSITVLVIAIRCFTSSPQPSLFEIKVPRYTRLVPLLGRLEPRRCSPSVSLRANWSRVSCSKLTAKFKYQISRTYRKKRIFGYPNCKPYARHHMFLQPLLGQYFRTVVAILHPSPTRLTMW